MKFLPLASVLLAAAVAGCGSLSIPGTPETATSLNGFRASHGLSQLSTDGALTAPPASTRPTWRAATASTTTAS